MNETKNSGRISIGVIGMGPVGSILAAHLIDAGAFVIPCDIDHDKIDQIKNDGIHLKHRIEKNVKPVEACYSIPELEHYKLDLVCISVKTPILKKVISQLSEIATDKMFIMSVQNGIDNELAVAKVFGGDKTLRMVINYAGSMSDLNTVQVGFFNPPNYVSALMHEGRVIAEKFTGLLNSVELTTEIPEDIRNHIWEKAILNAALAPVCAITGKTMKNVMDSPNGQELVQAIIDESTCVAEAEGIKLAENFRQFSLRYLKSGGNHRPSMLVDLEQGLPTEIDNLNGKIVEYGKKHDIPTPVNQSITALVRLMENL